MNWSKVFIVSLFACQPLVLVHCTASAVKDTIERGSSTGSASEAAYMSSVAALETVNYIAEQKQTVGKKCEQLYSDLINNRVNEQRWNEYYRKCKKMPSLK